MKDRKKLLIEHIKNNGKNMTWSELADLYGLAQDKSKSDRGEYARSVWRNYLKSESKKRERFDEKSEITRIKRWQIYDGQWRESIQYDLEKIDTDRIVEYINNNLVNYKPPKPFYHKNVKHKDNCAIINIFDAHIDKIAFIQENGSIEDNIKRFEKSFDSLLSSALSYNPELIIFPVGSDFWNTNSDSGHTKKGTYVGHSENFFVSFEKGLELYRRCIDKASQYAKVLVPVIGGNHDEDKVNFLGIALSIAYEKNNRVTIDSDRKQRKYYMYGENMFGFAHGDKEKLKIDHLPLMMAEEEKEMWSKTKYREFYLGDIHHKREYKFLRGKDFIGCTVRFLRSISSQDKWHNDFGWIGVPKTAEAFIWNKKTGLEANLMCNIK
jgi:hypothetical protein